MDPRRSRFSPYEMRGGPPQRQSGYVQGPPPAAPAPPVNGAGSPPSSQFQRNESFNADFQNDGNFARSPPPRHASINSRVGSSAGGPLMRPRGSYIGNRGHHASEGRQFHSDQYSSDPSPYNRRSASRWEGGRYNDGAPAPANERPRLPQYIRERLARERPCRTLFVRNVQYDIQPSEIRQIFERFGEIREIFNLIEKRGMVFVSFYDIRAAEAAKEATQGSYLRNRQIDVHYSLPKEEEQDAKCDRTKNQGTLLFTLKNSDLALQDHELYDYFARFGDVKVIRTPHFRNHTENNELRQRFVEFYDSRDCVRAYDACHGQPYKNGYWDVSFFWDHTNKERYEAFALKRERPKDRGSDRRDSGGRRHGGGRDIPPKARGVDEFGRTLRYDHYENRNPSPRPESIQQTPQYNPEERQRLEQAQKAQQLLTMAAQGSETQAAPSSFASPTQSVVPVPAPYVPPVANQVPAAPPPVSQSVTAGAPAPAPAPIDQAAQVQQLLGLLTQVAAQQQQQIQQQQQQQQQQQHQAAQAPADAAAALNQLAQLLQTQQQQQQQPLAQQPPSTQGNNSQ